MIKIGSDFSGVGAFPQALIRLGIEYDEEINSVRMFPFDGLQRGYDRENNKCKKTFLFPVYL